jgi:excisionase family DNA binding protein
MTTSAGGMPIAVFCETYGVGRTKTYDLINSGAISARKSGKTTLIDRASAERWYESLPSYGTGQPRSRITRRGRAEAAVS